MSHTDTFILPTDQNQILTHQNILSVGESLRQHYVEVAEDEKQRAVRCTEEVVRREEQQLKDEELREAHGEWKIERQQLFQEAHQSQLRAIARHNDILEKELRQEFSDTLEKTRRKHEKDILEAVQKTWEEADVVKQSAVAETRLEEHAAARREAGRVAEQVVGEKTTLAQNLEEEKQHALQEQKVTLNDVHLKDLEAQKKELTLQFEQQIAMVSSGYDAKFAEHQTRYDEQLATSQTLQQELADMTDTMNNWRQKYEKLKLEFSDFIDQFPGFRGEFIIK